MYFRSISFLPLLLQSLYADVDKWPSVEEDHTKLQIVVPDILQKKGGYQHRDALFGLPAYSTGSLQTQLIDAGTDGCKDFENKDWEPPFALLIERGGCHFVEKVRRAQHAGARAVIIADNSCLCTDTDCMRTTGDTMCEGVLPYMADDESGGDITIPSMLIRKSDAKAIKKHMKYANGVSNVMVQFDWGVPSPDGRVEWTMWHSSWDEESTASLKQIETIADTLGSRAFFTPRFVSYNGSKVGCHGASTNSPCGNMCLNSGRYCLLDPSPYHDQSSGASGADVVAENLRRKCIWNIVSQDDPGVGRKWWRYINEFANMCNIDEKHFKDLNCVKKVMKKVGLDFKEIEECMQPYGPNVDKDNSLLMEELKEQTGLQLLRLPALYVDGVHARGSINSATMLSMVCAGYGVHDPPAVCECASQPAPGLSECVKSGSYEAMSKAHSGGIGFFGILTIILLVAGGVGVVAFVHWKRSQEQMREQVRSILAEYMPLEDQSMPGELDSPRVHPAVIASAMSPRGFLPTTDVEDENDV